MLLRIKTILLIASLFCSCIVSAEVYKWKDEFGRTHFSDQPPLNKQAENINLEEIVTYSSATVVDNDVELDTQDEKQQSKKYKRKKRVVIYSAVWCGVCTKAKNYFKKNKIAFKEYDIDKSKKGKRDFKKLKARGIPVILVGKKRLNGFNVSKFESLYRS